MDTQKERKPWNPFPLAAIERIWAGFEDAAMSEPTLEMCEYYLRGVAPGRIVETWCGKPAFDYVMEEDSKVWLCPEHLREVGPKPVSSDA